MSNKQATTITNGKTAGALVFDFNTLSINIFTAFFLREDEIFHNAHRMAL